jgi:hypothetical protein
VPSKRHLAQIPDPDPQHCYTLKFPLFYDDVGAGVQRAGQPGEGVQEGRRLAQQVRVSLADSHHFYPDSEARFLCGFVSVPTGYPTF